MPPWAIVALAALALVAVAAIIINAAVVFLLISRLHHTHVLICHLYARERLPLPPDC